MLAVFVRCELASAPSGAGRSARPATAGAVAAPRRRPRQGLPSGCYRARYRQSRHRNGAAMRSRPNPQRGDNIASSRTEGGAGASFIDGADRQSGRPRDAVSDERVLRSRRRPRWRCHRHRQWPAGGEHGALAAPAASRPPVARQTPSPAAPLPRCGVVWQVRHFSPGGTAAGKGSGVCR